LQQTDIEVPAVFTVYCRNSLPVKANTFDSNRNRLARPKFGLENDVGLSC